jgi:hypothetical protein
MQGSRWTRLDRVAKVMARAEARARAAERTRRREPPQEELTPAQLEAWGHVQARVKVVEEIVTRQQHLLECLHNRPITPEALADLVDEWGEDANLCLFRELVLLDDLATELMMRTCEMAPDGTWPPPCGRGEDCRCNHKPLAEWVADVPAFIAAGGRLR